VPEVVRAFGRSGCEGDLIVVGDPNRDARESERLRTAIAASQRPIRLAGVLSPEALRGLYARARLFISASGYEGWPVAVAEAMASGVPVAAFANPGVSELVRHRADGLLVPAGDVAGLARAVAELWTDTALGERLGRDGRVRARQWPTWEATARFVADLVLDASGVDQAPVVPGGQRPRGPQVTGAR
jgi:glycosyltransferase involved in cell wall biosynthesis